MFAAEALAITQLSVRRGRSAAFAEAVGLAIPAPGKSTGAGDRALLWIQPAVYLLIGPLDDAGAIAASAAVVDQSDGRSGFTLAGASARGTLAKGCRLDLHPRAFAPGDVASTSIAHVNALVWMLDASPRFRLLVPSSYADAFAEWLAEAAER